MDKKPAKRERKPRKISQTYLENASLYYLERFASSASNFRRVMMRKVKRSCDFHKVPIDEFIPMVDALTERYVEVGLLNDEVFARSKTASLRRKGFGKQAIIAKLQPKGLSRDVIEKALSEIDAETENPEFEAALKYIKRKKLGIYRIKPIKDPIKDKQRELGSLARAGFSYEIAKKALDHS